MHNILCFPLEFACLVDGSLRTLTSYFGHHGSVGRQLTATLTDHHSTICYKYVMIVHVIYVQWMLEINYILLYSISGMHTPCIHFASDIDQREST